MRQLLLIFILFVLGLASKELAEDKIIRPIKFGQIPQDASLFKEMEKDKTIPEHSGQLEYIEEEEDSDSSSSDDDYEFSMDESQSMKKSEENLKKAFQLFTVILSDYADYDDYDSAPKQDFQRRNPADEEMKRIESISPAEFITGQKPKPFLAIDPPRKPLPDFSHDEKPQETFSKDPIPIPVILKESSTETESILIPWNISISIDVSHLMVIVLAGFLFFWIIQKAFAYYLRPRQIVISPVSAEDGSVRKVPLE